MLQRSVSFLNRVHTTLGVGGEWGESTSRNDNHTGTVAETASEVAALAEIMTTLRCVNERDVARTNGTHTHTHTH